jgi:hypothetical protein
MTTTRDSILANVHASLLLIDGTGSYLTTVKTVDAQPKAFADGLNAELLPYVGWMPRKGADVIIGSHVIRKTQYVDIGAHVVGATVDAANTALNNLIEDIDRAMLTDVTRGGFAIQTLPAEAPDTTEGDADTIDPAHGGYLGTAVLSFSIDYDYVMPH